MRNRFFVLGVLIAGSACTSYADTAVEGPRLGYVSTNEGIRTVLGIVGASQLSQPIHRDIHDTAVLPQTSIAIGIASTGELMRVDLNDESTTDLKLNGVTRIEASPAGEAFLAIAGSEIHTFLKSGKAVASYGLPGEPLSISVADEASAVAVIVAEAEGEALYLIDERGARRLLHSSDFAAIVFLANSKDFLVAEESGAIHRVGSDLQLTQVGSVPGIKALAGTPDRSRLLAVTEQTIYSIHFDSGNTSSVDCSCKAVKAKPLGGSTFLLTNTGEGPMWVVSAAAEELRVAFIPEAVNE